jgi:hypothetical protein
MASNKLSKNNPLSTKLSALVSIAIDNEMQQSLQKLAEMYDVQSIEDLTLDLEIKSFKNNQSLVVGYYGLNSVSNANIRNCSRFRKTSTRSVMNASLLNNIFQVHIRDLEI